VVDRIGEVARKHNVSNTQIALAWILCQPGVVAPIIGASKLHQLDEAIAALHIRLENDDLEALAEPYQPHSVLGHS
jgi:aryl-alcohol dehydrogenase-like predicted oxidoreductase